MSQRRNHKPKLIGVQPRQLSINIMVSLVSGEPAEWLFTDVFKSLVRKNEDVKKGVEQISGSDHKELYIKFCEEMSAVEVHIYTFLQNIPGAPLSMGNAAVMPGTKHIVNGRKYNVLGNTFESSEFGLLWLVEVERAGK